MKCGMRGRNATVLATLRVPEHTVLGKRVLS